MPRILILASLLLIVSFPTSASAAEPRALLITGLGTKDPAHPKHILQHEFYNDRIVEVLRGIAQVTVTEDLSALNPQTLRSYDLVLNNSFLLEPTAAQLEALFEFIEAGNSYIALHAGLASFINSDRYVRMMGGHLAGHDALKDMVVETYEDGFGRERTSPWAHPIARGLANFTTHDELYVVQTNTDQLQVIARSESHPIVYVRPWGNGAVLVFTLGHASESIENPGYQALLRNSVRWMTGYPIIEPLRAPVFTSDAGTVEDAIDLRQVTHIRSNASVSFSLLNDRPDLVEAAIDADRRVDLRFAQGRTGTATITVQAVGVAGRTDSKELKLAVVDRGAGNVAAYHGVTAHSSSNEARYSVANPALVIDGDPATRWSSDYVDPSWIHVDLGMPYRIDRVRLVWDGAYASKYDLQVSNDAQHWQTMAARTGNQGIDEMRLRPTPARYVRMLGKARATRYGYSLYEFEVYGQPARD